MAIEGRFGASTGRPYVDCRLHLPALHISGDITMVIDTGADRTYLTPGDVTRLGLDYGQLPAATAPVLSAGGASFGHVLRAILSFTDSENVYGYDIDVVIAARDSLPSDAPSLLGRDVLDRWDLRYRSSTRQIRAEVDSADVVVRRSAAYDDINPDERLE